MQCFIDGTPKAPDLILSEACYLDLNEPFDEKEREEELRKALDNYLKTLGWRSLFN
jgi:hypothetical protein